MTTRTPTFDHAMATAGLVPHAEQSAMAGMFERVHDACRIGFVEAPTATGKTLVIAHSALRLAARGDGPVVVAVPTIGVAQRTIDAIARLAETSPAFRRVGVSLVLGRQEFLSPAGLDALTGLLGPDQRDVVAEWIGADAPGRTRSHPSWTRDGLEAAMDGADVVCPQLDSPALALARCDRRTDAWRAYEAQFAEGAGVVVATHAMLGRDLLSRFVETSRERRRLGMEVDPSLPPIERWLLANVQRHEVETGDEGRLPDHRRLIVDEAHLLRDAVANAMTTGVAIASLQRHVEALAAATPSPVPAATVKAIASLRKRLEAIGRDRGGDSVMMSWNAEDEDLQGLLRDLDRALSRITTKGLEGDAARDGAEIDRARYAVAESLRARTAVSTIFEWSPVLRFPTIGVGRRNLVAELDFLWGRLDAAALTSATLYTDNVAGPSIGHTAGRLSVPAERVMEFPPIPATWIMAPVTALLPSRETAAAFEPGDDGLRLDAVADGLAEAATRSTRGLLALTTSRADTRDLCARLAPILGERLIDGTSDRMVRLADRFEAAARSGGRPVWIAQGPAWTGLDLDDRTIDWLAITRLPFPRRDPTRDGRAAHYGAAKIATMAMTLKQGVGRLVRSRNAEPKTLVVLDGRIATLPSASGVLAYLRRYSHASM